MHEMAVIICFLADMSFIGMYIWLISYWCNPLVDSWRIQPIKHFIILRFWWVDTEKLLTEIHNFYNMLMLWNITLGAYLARFSWLGTDAKRMPNRSTGYIVVNQALWLYASPHTPRTSTRVVWIQGKGCWALWQLSKSAFHTVTYRTKYMRSLFSFFQ